MTEVKTIANFGISFILHHGLNGHSKVLSVQIPLTALNNYETVIKIASLSKAMITKKLIGFRNVTNPQFGLLSSKLPASKPKADSNETELISEKVHKYQALELHRQMLVNDIPLCFDGL